MYYKIKLHLSLSLFLILISLLFARLSYSQDNSIYDSLLKDYIKNGLVDYEHLKDDARLDTYLVQLSETDPKKFQDKNSEMAFWINSYNAFTLKIICENYPVKSITDLNNGGKLLNGLTGKTVWDKSFITINGRKISLNYIENNILRQKFNDPRIHFAIVCASISCPPIRPEAYSAAILSSQLNDHAKEFFNDTTRNSFNAEKRIANLSHVLDWFGKDFGKNDKEKLLFVSTFLPKEISTDINNHASEWTINYKNYDWGLNKQ